MMSVSYAHLAFIIARKITLTEARHAEIVEELEHRFSVATSENEVKANVVSLVTPTTGYLVDLSSVNDEHFASGSMGKGFAIKPTDGAVFAPISGTTVSYTHLDVYKRQGTHSLGTRRSIRSPHDRSWFRWMCHCTCLLYTSRCV